MKIWEMIVAGDRAGLEARMAELNSNLDARLAHYGAPSSTTAVATTPKRRRRTVKSAPAAELPMSGYGRMIAMLAPRALSADEIRWVEAWMRVEHSSLNGLSQSQAKKEIGIALECIAASPTADSEALAQSYGL